MVADERMLFLEEMGLHETGLARVIRAGYELLHLLTFFTVGPKEARAWTVHTGARAPEAAGESHSAFPKGLDRKSVVAGRREAGREVLGGCRILKNKIRRSNGK